MVHRLARIPMCLHHRVQTVLGQAASSSHNNIFRPKTYATSADNDRSTLAEFDPESVTILDVPSEPPVFPALHCDADEYRRFYRQAKVYVLGTAHGFVESIVDITDLMRKVRPDVVFLELDEQRMSRVLSRKWRASEFLAAHLQAKRLPDCEVVLGDRPVNITFMRVGFKGLLQFLRMPFREENMEGNKRIMEIITKGDSIVWNKALRDEFLHEIRRMMSTSAPHFWKVIGEERDLYLTYTLKKALNDHAVTKYNLFQGRAEPVRVVAVVGRAHVDGIKAHWGKEIDQEQFEKLNETPDDAIDPIKFKFRPLFTIVNLVLLYYFLRYVYRRLTPSKEEAETSS